MSHYRAPGKHFLKVGISLNLKILQWNTSRLVPVSLSWWWERVSNGHWFTKQEADMWWQCRLYCCVWYQDLLYCSCGMFMAYANILILDYNASKLWHTILKHESNFCVQLGKLLKRNLNKRINWFSKSAVPNDHPRLPMWHQSVWLPGMVTQRLSQPWNMWSMRMASSSSAAALIVLWECGQYMDTL